MRYFKLQVIKYSYLPSETWSLTPEVISDAYDIDVGFRLGELNDTFEFKLSNPNGSNKNTFKVQDRVTVHFLLNGDTYSDSNMLINGIVKGISQTSGEKGEILSISGVSFGEITTTGLVFATSINKNCMEHIDNCRQSIALRNGNFGITWNSGNPSLKSDGVTAFPKLPTYNTREYDKSFYKILETYLTNEYTDDGNYYWYVNNAKELVIRKRLSTQDTSLIEGTDDILTHKIGVDASKIYNFIVVKCGNDPRGSPMSSRYDDPVSRTQYGFRYYMLIRTDIGTNLLDYERTQGGIPVDKTFPTAYPYTIRGWKDSLGADIVVNSDKEFVEEFRIHAKDVGALAGKNYATMYSSKLHQLTVVLPPTNAYSIGSMIMCNFPSYGLNNILMRVTEITYSDENTMLTLLQEVAT